MMNLISSRFVIILVPFVNVGNWKGQYCIAINLFVGKRGHIGEKHRSLVSMEEFWLIS